MREEEGDERNFNHTTIGFSYISKMYMMMRVYKRDIAREKVGFRPNRIDNGL